MINLEKLLQTGKTVFTADDLKKILNTTNEWTIRHYLSRIGKNGVLTHLYYGIWWFLKFDIYELACKLHKKSYISFETVLKKEWVIFQYYGDMIFLAGDKSIEKQAVGKIFKTNKLKESILLNPVWVEHIGNYAIASRERAICDRLYLTPGYHFDDLEWVSWDRLEQISQIYNKRLILEVKKLREKHAQ